MRTYNCFPERITEMQHWNPTLVTNVDLHHMQLETFHVGTLVNLQVLNLSDNAITSIEKSGLEQCVRLRSLNLSKNRLARERCLPVLPYDMC